jgi:hypothetical protein
LSLISSSLAFSLALVAGSVCLGVFTEVAMWMGLSKLNRCPLIRSPLGSVGVMLFYCELPYHHTLLGI